MSTEMAAVVITAILGPLLVLGISEFLRYKSAIKEREERFFYELFPKRLALYEEIIKALDYIEDSEIPFFSCNTAWELSSFYKEKCNVLAHLRYRCTMLGSEAVGNLLTVLHGFHAEGSKIALRLDSLLHNPLSADAKEQFVNSFTPNASAMKIKILEEIRKETGRFFEILQNKIKLLIARTKEYRYSKKSTRVLADRHHS